MFKQRNQQSDKWELCLKPPLFSAIKSSREWQNSDNFAGCFACIPSPRTMPLGKMVTRLVQNGWNSATDPLYIKKKQRRRNSHLPLSRNLPWFSCIARSENTQTYDKTSDKVQDEERKVQTFNHSVINGSKLTVLHQDFVTWCLVIECTQLHSMIPHWHWIIVGWVYSAPPGIHSAELFPMISTLLLKNSDSRHKNIVLPSITAVTYST